MLEADFHRNVVELAQYTRWRIHHDRGDYRECIAGDPGFPDLVLARDGRLIISELKSESGKLTYAQHDWLEALSGVDGWDTTRRAHRSHAYEVYLWRPDDIDRVAKILSPR